MRHSRGHASRRLGIVLVVIIGMGALAAAWRLWPERREPAPVAASNASALAPVVASDVVGGGVADEQPPVVREESAPPVAVIPMVAPAAAPAIPEISVGNNPVGEAQSLTESGELIRARAILNAAVLAGKLSGAEAETARQMMAKISQQAVFGPRILRGDPHAEAYTVQPGERLAKIATGKAVTWELLCRVNGISDPRKVRAFQTIKLVKGPFHAVVDKSHFTMDIYLGAPGGPNSLYVTSFPVGLGKDDSTPAGTWVVTRDSKLKNPPYYSPRGEGIIQADDPSNPLGEFWIGLTGVDGDARDRKSYGIHGTIDPASIGKAESMGCIRLRNEDIALVFELLVEGRSTVVVKD